MEFDALKMRHQGIELGRGKERKTGHPSRENIIALFWGFDFCGGFAWLVGVGVLCFYKQIWHDCMESYLPGWIGWF